jgi:inosose dehydratase
MQPMRRRLSRRAFVSAAAAATAWTELEQLPLASSTVAPAAAPLKLGVASYSLREFPLDQALDMTRKLGVSYMTFKDVHLPRTDPPAATRALAAKIKAAGISIMGGGTITLPNDPAQINTNSTPRIRCPA